MLKGRNAIVTGSTSGIGKGIARTLAEQGCGIMLNGFGEMEAIEGYRSELVRTFNVEVSTTGLIFRSQANALTSLRTRKSG